MTAEANCLHKAKEPPDDRIFIPNESIGIGQEKLLVIWGIRRSQIDFTRPLQLQDIFLYPSLNRIRSAYPVFYA
jgi:hypothetical protein